MTNGYSGQKTDNSSILGGCQHECSICRNMFCKYFLWKALAFVFQLVIKIKALFVEKMFCKYFLWTFPKILLEVLRNVFYSYSLRKLLS